MTIEVTNRRSVVSDLKKYCHLASDTDTMEITEWINGEGFDVTILYNGRAFQNFSLTYGEAELLQLLISYKE